MSCVNPIFANEEMREQIMKEQFYGEQFQQAMREEAIRRRNAMLEEAMKHPVTRERITKRIRMFQEVKAHEHKPFPQVNVAIRPVTPNRSPGAPSIYPKPLPLTRGQLRQIRGILSYYDIHLAGKVVWMRPVEVRTQSLDWGFPTRVLQPVLLRSRRPVHKTIWRQVVLRAGQVIAKKKDTEAQVRRLLIRDHDRHAEANNSWGDPDNWSMECVICLGKPLD